MIIGKDEQDIWGRFRCSLTASKNEEKGKEAFHDSLPSGFFDRSHGSGIFDCVHGIGYGVHHGCKPESFVRSSHPILALRLLPEFQAAFFTPYPV